MSAKRPRALMRFPQRGSECRAAASYPDQELSTRPQEQFPAALFQVLLRSQSGSGAYQAEIQGTEEKNTHFL